MVKFVGAEFRYDIPLSIRDWWVLMVMSMCGGPEANGLEYKGITTFKSDISIRFLL